MKGIHKFLWGVIFPVWLLAFVAMAGIPQLLGVGSYPAATTYAGPGNIVANAQFWGGLRAYNSAARGTSAINVCNVADVACGDLSTDPSTGALVISTIGGSSCSVVVCTIKTLYDQSGANACSGAPCDLTQATIGNRPTLVVSCINGLPCMAFARASTQSLAETVGLGITSATGSVVAIRTGNNTSFHEFFVWGQAEILFSSTASNAGIFSTSAVNKAATDNNWHAIQAYGPSATAYINVNDTGNAVGNTGGALVCGGLHLGVFCTGGTDPLDGKVAEAGLWSGDAFTPTQQTSMCHNQFTYWGTSVSC